MCILAIIVAAVTMIDFIRRPFLLQDKQYFVGHKELFFSWSRSCTSCVNLLTMCLYKNRKKSIELENVIGRILLVIPLYFKALRPGLVEEVRGADYRVLKL